MKNVFRVIIAPKLVHGTNIWNWSRGLADGYFHMFLCRGIFEEKLMLQYSLDTYFEMTVISFLDFGLGQLSTHTALVHKFFSNIHKGHPPIWRIIAHGTVPGGKML
jgi:hypothetical protein